MKFPIVILVTNFKILSIFFFHASAAMVLGSGSQLWQGSCTVLCNWQLGQTTAAVAFSEIGSCGRHLRIGSCGRHLRIALEQLPWQSAANAGILFSFHSATVLNSLLQNV